MTERAASLQPLILKRISSFLSLLDVVQCMRACRRWSSALDDESVWRSLFLHLSPHTSLPPASQIWKAVLRAETSRSRSIQRLQSRLAPAAERARVTLLGQRDGNDMQLLIDAFLRTRRATDFNRQRVLKLPKARLCQLEVLYSQFQETFACNDDVVLSRTRNVYSHLFCAVSPSRNAHARFLHALASVFGNGYLPRQANVARPRCRNAATRCRVMRVGRSAHLGSTRHCRSADTAGTRPETRGKLALPVLRRATVGRVRSRRLLRGDA